MDKINFCFYEIVCITLELHFPPFQKNKPANCLKNQLDVYRDDLGM